MDRVWMREGRCFGTFGEKRKCKRKGEGGDTPEGNRACAENFHPRAVDKQPTNQPTNQPTKQASKQAGRQENG
ncbi:hypothetical protein M0802_015594 [Mischocyttarus mexicanus]|nr:hypothetical protein M0802_015594 [Mischocyttarus mexicanus]